MNKHDWFYRVFDRDTPASVFGTFAPVVSVWRAKCSGADVPEWSEFEIDDLIEWYPGLSLAEVMQDFSNMVFLLWGTKLVELWNEDYTGRVFADNQFPEHWQTIEQPYIEEVVKRAGIGVCGGTLHTIGREFINITYIDLPVRRAGKTPFLMSVYLRDADRTLLTSTKPVYEFIEEYETASTWRDI